MTTIPISVVIISKDEARAIGRCVESVADYDEVFVVDSHSTDGTVELAEAAGATVVQFTWNRHYPKKKQWALENLPLSHDWVLYLDGDEYSTPEFDDEVRGIVAGPAAAAAYDVGLDYVWLGRTLRHGHKVYKRVLFDRRRAAWLPLDDLTVEQPFEMELHVQPTVEGSTARTARRIVHDDLEPLTHWFERHNRYSDWETVLRREHVGRAERTWQGRIWESVPAKSLIFFAYAYVFRLGFLDGVAGLHYAIANSFYYWQIGVKVRADRLK